MSDELLERYIASTGREPTRLPEDHPDAWQWDYRGTPAERDALLASLAGRHEEETFVHDQAAVGGVERHVQLSMSGF